MSSRWQKRSRFAFTFMLLHFTLLCVKLVMFNSNSFLVAGAGINLSLLVIKEGKVCWDLYIDGLVISSDGNLLDALGAAIKVILDSKAESMFVLLLVSGVICPQDC